MEFFTNGWVNLLTPSETVAYLMWLDVTQNPVHEEPYVTGVERAGHFGLGRDAYDAVWLKGAISRLKPALRDTAVLVAGQQLTHAEAAEILGIAEATVAWRMHEARRILASEK